MTGVDRFAREIVLAIDGLLLDAHPVAQGMRWRIALPADVFDPLPLRTIGRVDLGGTGNALWEQFRLATSAGSDVLVNLCNTAPLMLRRQAVVVHDAAPFRVPESYTRSFRAWYRLAIPLLCRRSEAVMSVSAFSAAEIAGLASTRHPVAVLTEGCDHMDRLRADDAIHQRRRRPDRPYVLAVGSLAPHKNFKLLIDAVAGLAEPEFDVLIAGGIDPRIFGAIGQALPHWVQHLGYVSDDQLKSLYQRAALFVFPSRYEGFGLPPVEAMACGCPVLASDAPALVETCAGAALHFSHADTAGLASLITRVVNDPALRASLTERSLRRAAQLRWRTAAVAMLEALRARFMAPAAA